MRPDQRLVRATYSLTPPMISSTSIWRRQSDTSLSTTSCESRENRLRATRCQDRRIGVIGLFGCGVGAGNCRKITRISKPSARLATACPMRPKPTMPNVAPLTSGPRKSIGRPCLPPARTREFIALHHAACRRHQQGPGKIGGGCSASTPGCCRWECAAPWPPEYRCCRSPPPSGS